MISYLMRKAFASFGRRYNYDISHLEEVSDIYSAKAWRYMLLTPFSQHYTAASKEACFAAKITSTHMADCGPCTNLTLQMAIEAGIDRTQLSAILLGDKAAMSPDILLGYNYAYAMNENSPAFLDLIQEVEIQFGKRGLWDMASAVAMGDFYPKLKRGLGKAKSCLAPAEIAKEISNGERKNA